MSSSSSGKDAKISAFSFVEFMDLSVYNQKSLGSNYDQRGKLNKEKNHFVEFTKAERGSITA